VDRGISEKKFLRIAEIIGKNKKVFEIGCGTAFLADYLKQGCSYIGWDLNKNFVDDCCKRGLKVFQKNIFDFDDYPDNDVIVISDVLHHIIPRDKELIREAKERTKKLIVTEPRTGLKFNSKRTPFCVYEIFDKFLGDNDGINPLAQRIKWGFADEEELHEYFQKFSPKKIIFLGKNKEKFIAIL
jgi:SAM-dependent methyltransferase